VIVEQRADRAAHPVTPREDRRRNDAERLRRCLDEGASISTLEDAAIRLVDSSQRIKLKVLLDRIVPDVIAQAATLSFAMGRLAVLRSDFEDALAWLTKSQAAVVGGQAGLAGRIAFELGCLHVQAGRYRTADAVLAWAEGTAGRAAGASADLTHLRALLADAQGQWRMSLDLYRAAIESAGAALSPLTRVLAMRNLAAALAHREPRESIALCGLALATIAAEDLDPIHRASLRNILSYALICDARTGDGAVMAARTVAEARQSGNVRTERFAMFNAAIAAEHMGEHAIAVHRLEELIDRVTSDDELAGWARLRLGWLALASGNLLLAAERISSALREPIPTLFSETVATVRALLSIAGGDHGRSEESLNALAAWYEARGDALTCFVLQFWIAKSRLDSGRVRAARLSLRRAIEIGRAHGFRLSPNWWCPAITIAAAALAEPEDRDYVRALYIAPSSQNPPPSARKVTVTQDGTVDIAGVTMATALWSRGRTGSGVLRRYFRALLAAYPATLARDDLADLLWPDSEGDKAVRNLYGATTDLRAVLASVPGVSLAVEAQRYGLQAGPGVIVLQ
jgi:tetratricopeptide (TPR) repeat protein